MSTMSCELFLTKHRELPHGEVCPRCCANLVHLKSVLDVVLFMN